LVGYTMLSSVKPTVGKADANASTSLRSWVTACER
jgi:hypothetical protein